MLQIKLYLFGSPRLERNGQAVSIPLRKAFALLIYLAITRHAHSRDALATLFWPEKEQQAARANLRRTLYDLSRFLGEQLLEVGPETVALSPHATVWLDVEAFQTILGHSWPVHSPTEAVEEATYLPLIAAAKLYADDFLAGFTLPDCPAFDDWQFFQREELRRAFANLLRQLLFGCHRLGKLEEAIQYARRWLQLDPFEEAAYRHLMQLYADAGQVAAAVRQYEECVRMLEIEFGVTPEEETTALFEAIRTRRYPVPSHRHERAAALAEGQKQQSTVTPGREFAGGHAVAKSPLHNLPVQLTPFVGRVHELDEVVRSLSLPTCRLLSIIGPGGIGKTRLALQAALRIMEEMRQRQRNSTSLLDIGTTMSSISSLADGVYFVPLQHVDADSGLISAIAEATGFYFYSDTPPYQQLVNFLREKQLLLILDGMENVPEGATLISDLLAKTPTIKLLVTSQRSLNLHEEWFHPVAGMTLPQLNDHPAHFAATGKERSRAIHADAVQFFVQCAMRARADFDLDGEWEHVVRICRLVDGVPLALELAAAWLKVLPCKQIADEISQSLHILTARHQNIPTRHRSMHAILQQSWQQLLDEAEQVVLRRLSIFRGGFTQEAALEVVDTSLLTLATLVEKALVRLTANGRYQMHELLRQFAHQQLVAHSQEENMIRTRHSAYYLGMLITQAPLLIRRAQRTTLAQIGQEIENVRLGWEWVVQQHNLDILSQAIEPLYHFYQIQSRYQEGKDIFSRAWASLQPSSATDRAPCESKVLVAILARSGAFHYFLCEYDAANHSLQECLALAQSLGQRGETAFALNFLGQLAVWQGEQERAKQYLFQSLTICRELGDKIGAASALDKLANLSHATFGEYSESKQLAEQSLALSRELGRTDWIAYALDTLGFINFCLGEYDEATSYYQESLALFEVSNDYYGIAMALGGIGLVLWAKGEQSNADAIDYLQKSLQICRTIGHQGQVVGRLAGLARIANDLGEHRQAQQVAFDGLPVARELGSPIYLSHLLCCLGEATYAIGELSAARGYLLEALKLTSGTGLLAHISIALFHYAILLIKESVEERDSGVQKRAQALELLAFVQRHPATWHVYKQRAKQHIAELEGQLPATTVTTAKERAERRTMEGFVKTPNNDLLQ